MGNNPKFLIHFSNKGLAIADDLAIGFARRTLESYASCETNSIPAVCKSVFSNRLVWDAYRMLVLTEFSSLQDRIMWMRDDKEVIMNKYMVEQNRDNKLMEISEHIAFEIIQVQLRMRNQDKHSKLVELEKSKAQSTEHF